MSPRFCLICVATFANASMSVAAFMAAARSAVNDADVASRALRFSEREQRHNLQAVELGLRRATCIGEAYLEAVGLRARRSAREQASRGVQVDPRRSGAAHDRPRDRLGPCQTCKSFVPPNTRHGHAARDVAAARGQSPWRRRKRAPCFADMLAALRADILRRRLSRHPLPERVRRNVLRIVLPLCGAAA